MEDLKVGGKVVGTFVRWEDGGNSYIIQSVRDKIAAHVDADADADADDDADDDADADTDANAEVGDSGSTGRVEMICGEFNMISAATTDPLKVTFQTPFACSAEHIDTLKEELEDLKRQIEEQRKGRQ